MKYLILFVGLSILPALGIASEWSVGADSNAQVSIPVAAVLTASGSFVAQPGQTPPLRGRFFLEERRSGFPRITACETNIDARTAHTGYRPIDPFLRGELFLDTQNYPEIIFRCLPGGATEPDANGNFQLRGILTVKGVEKEIVLDAQVTGSEPGRIHFTGKVVLDRNDFKITGGKFDALLGSQATIQMKLTLESTAPPTPRPAPGSH